MIVKEGKGNRNILSIESAVTDGSVAVISERFGSIFKRDGDGSSRAEKLILVIGSVLDEAGMTLRDLHLIAVSIGPGSYSGIRIGMSTAIGLGNALDIPYSGVSVLDAMAFSSKIQDPFIAAIPVGKTDVAWQPFEVGNDGVRRGVQKPQLSSSLTFLKYFEGHTGAVLLAQNDLLTRVAGGLPAATVCVDAGIGLAEVVGRYASVNDEPIPALRPIYLRNRDAAVRPGAF